MWHDHDRPWNFFKILNNVTFVLYCDCNILPFTVLSHWFVSHFISAETIFIVKYGQK